MGRCGDDLHSSGQPHPPLTLLNFDLGLFSRQQLRHRDDPTIPTRQTTSLLVEILSNNIDGQSWMRRFIHRCHCNGVTPLSSNPWLGFMPLKLFPACQPS